MSSVYYIYLIQFYLQPHSKNKVVSFYSKFEKLIFALYLNVKK